MSAHSAQLMPVTPFKRDQHQSSSPARSSPLRSSPLNPQYRLNNPPSQRRASSSNHFHVQSRYVRPTANVTGSGSTLGASSSDQNPQKALWRERFRQKCAERVERDRAKYQTATRQRSGTSLGLSDGDMSSEGDEMDVEDGDAMDDSLYSVFIAEERRRRNYAQKVSYAQAVGSSIDPDMEGFDEYERHFAGTSEQREPSPPPDFYSDDVDISFPDDYAAPDDANHDHYRSSEPPDTDMDFSSPPASPTQKPQHLHAAPQDASFVGMLLASPCPFCHAPYSLHVDDEMGHLGLVCAVCTNAFLLADANESWASMHAVFSSSHTPVAVIEPALSDGVVLLCSEPLCEWGLSL